MHPAPVIPRPVPAAAVSPQRGSGAELRRGAYRLLLVAAGVYDLALGAMLALAAETPFGWLGMEIPGRLVWRCAGAAIALFGVLYLHAARRKERARTIALLGLAAKVLAPAALLAGLALGAGEAWWRLLPLAATSALVWWIPLAALLLDGTRGADLVRRATPWVCAGLHGAAGLAMLFVLRGGTEAEPSQAARMAYVGAHAAAWRAGFAVWMAAGMSVLAFYAWWASWLRRPGIALAALVVAFAGLACDLTGEALYAGWLPLLASDAAGFGHVQRVGTALTSVYANGFYTLAGIVLTLGTPGLPRRVGALAWVVWSAGIALSVCGAMGWAAGLVAASGILFPGLVLLAVLLAREPR